MKTCFLFRELSLVFILFWKEEVKLPLFERSETVHAINFLYHIAQNSRASRNKKKLWESWLVFILRLRSSRQMSQILIQSRRYFAKIFLYTLRFKHLILVLSLSFSFSHSPFPSRKRVREIESDRKNTWQPKNTWRRLRFDSFTIHASLLALNHEQRSGDPRADPTSANRFAFARNFIFLARSMRVDWIFY